MEEIKPWTIYLFKKQSVLYGFAKAEYETGREIETVEFGYGFKIVTDKNSKLNLPQNKLKRARTSVVAKLSNTLNAIQMFGVDSFDENGEINWEKFQQEEFKHAFKVSRIQGSSYNKEVKEFEIVTLDLKTAKTNNLI